MIWTLGKISLLASEDMLQSVVSHPISVVVPSVSSSRDTKVFIVSTMGDVVRPDSGGTVDRYMARGNQVF